MIGYYAHHQGVGHVQRAVAVAARLPDELTVLSSAAPVGEVPWVRLSRDDDPAPGADADVTAHGRLHWAPLRHRGFRNRNRAIVDWLGRVDARLVVADVSVEVLALARLMSVPTVAVAMRGVRTDAPHDLGHGLATHVVAPWPEATQHDVPAELLERTTWVGPISRHDGRAPEPRDCDLPGRCVLLVVGRGGDVVRPTDLAEAAAVPGTHWHVLGDLAGREPSPLPSTLELLGWVPDPWPYLCRADVVVTTAGNNAVADVAAARRPAVVVPQPRPFDEQGQQAALLEHHGLAVVSARWPDRHRWPDLLDRAERLGGRRWAQFHDGSGAQRFAAALQEWSRA